MQYVEVSPVISLEEDQQLLVRVYPWYNGAATGKTICLSDITLGGIAMQDDSSGIRNIGDNKTVSTRFYSMDGRRQPTLSPGLNIVCQQMADGSVITKKIVR